MSLSLFSGPVKLDTSSTGDGLQHYDQICAISQAAINGAFSKLFEQQPLSARSVRWSNDGVTDGKLVATMLSPQIELDVESGDSARFMLQLRFDQGRIVFGQNTYQTIDGWVLAFTPLSFEDCVNASSGDLVAAAKLEDTEENVLFKSDHPTMLSPGEYSIHRLFAAIADLNWGSIIWERSYMTQPNGQKLFIDQWARDPANNALYNEVQQCLREWILENKLSTCFTQGMMLKVPRAKVSSEKVTFAPRTLRMQNYPYIEEERQLELKARKQDMKGINGNPYNCLCFCEVVGNRVDLPATKFLPFSGNLAGPMKGTVKEYLGTFVLDNRLFSAGNNLLSQLQDLCIAMQTIPLEPQARIGGNYTHSGRRRRVAGNTANLTAGKPYRWEEMRNDTWTATHIMVAAAKRKSRTSSLSKITIEAGPQMMAFKVSGEYGYTRRSELSSIVINDIATWTFTINVNGSPEIAENPAVLNNPSANFTGCKIEKDPYTGLDILIPDDFSVTPAENPSNPTWILTRAVMKINIGRALAKMASDFKPFQGINKFMYPGNSELKFGPTLLNEELNMFATIDFSPKEDRVSWPLPGTKTLDDDASTGVYSTDTSVTTDTPHLAWTSLVNTSDPLTGNIKISLTALNDFSDTIAFKSVAIIFLRMKGLDGNTLFKAEPEHWAAKDGSNSTPTETWSIATTNIKQALDLKVEALHTGLQFNIFPRVLDTAHDGTNLPSKFIIPSQGSFTLELSGTFNSKENAGVYVVQLNEVWVGVRPSRPLQGRASTFFVVELKADGKHPAPYTVTQTAANVVRGVPHS